MIANNVLRNVNQAFPDHCSPQWAVAYMHCEEHGLLNFLLEHAEKNTVQEFYKTLPMIYAKCTWICGDWSARGVTH